MVYESDIPKELLQKVKVICPYCKKTQECKIIDDGFLDKSYECGSCKKDFYLPTKARENIKLGLSIVGAILGIVGKIDNINHNNRS